MYHLHFSVLKLRAHVAKFLPVLMALMTIYGVENSIFIVSSMHTYMDIRLLRNSFFDQKCALWRIATLMFVGIRYFSRPDSRYDQYEISMHLFLHLFHSRGNIRLSFFGGRILQWMNSSKGCTSALVILRSAIFTVQALWVLLRESRHRQTERHESPLSVWCCLCLVYSPSVHSRRLIPCKCTRKTSIGLSPAWVRGFVLEVCRLYPSHFCQQCVILTVVWVLDVSSRLRDLH